MIFSSLKQTAEVTVDNICMAGYMEKQPVKSSQKKVQILILYKTFQTLFPIPETVRRLVQVRYCGIT